MSTRTDWGIFDKDGQPIAVGDLHHKHVCPQQKWKYDNGFDHPITGEWVATDATSVPCPYKFVSAKLDRCVGCGNEFRYP